MGPESSFFWSFGSVPAVADCSTFVDMLTLTSTNAPVSVALAPPFVECVFYEVLEQPAISGVRPGPEARLQGGVEPREEKDGSLGAEDMSNDAVGSRSAPAPPALHSEGTFHAWSVDAALSVG